VNSHFACYFYMTAFVQPVHFDNARSGKMKASGRNRRVCTLGVGFFGLALIPPVNSSGSILPNVVFTDSLASTSSTLNGATNVPTGMSTNYNIASTLAATSSISGGALKMMMPSTKSGFTEGQALFAGSPVVLTSMNDAIELTVTFTDVNSVGSGSANSAIYLGLYNSGGVAPYNNLQSSGLGAGTGQAAGGAQNWLGYVGQTFAPAGTPKIVTRPAQTSSTNSNQDLVSNGAVSTQSYHSPTGDNLTGSSTGLALPLTAGNQYTEEMVISLSAANTYSITSSLYSGVDDTGTLLATATGGNVLPADFLTSSFDSMAFGWRYSSSQTNTPEMDINSVIVSTTVPEPATVGIVALTAASLMHRWRKAIRAV
jgi:hypothetical protein